MKKLILLFAVILATACVVSGQWQSISTPSYYNPNPLYSAYYLGEVASNSTYYWAHNIDFDHPTLPITSYNIYRTTDGGLNWSIKNSSNDETAWLLSMEFISQDTGFIRSNSYGASPVYLTADGMSSLIPCSYSSMPEFNDVKMLSINNIYAADHNTFYHLDNNTFQIVNTLPTSFHYSSPIIEVTNNNHIYLACRTILGSPNSNNFIFKSEDSGFSWDTSFYDTIGCINDIKFLSNNLGFTVGNNGTIYKTEDAGETWNIKSSGLNFSLKSIDYNDESTWIATGTLGSILLTTDGGDTWDSIYSPTTQTIRRVKFPEKNGMAIIIASSYMWRTNLWDIITNTSTLIDLNDNFKIYPNPAKDYFTIENKSDEFRNTTLEIFNLVGEKIFTKNLNNKKENIDCNNFPEGTYFVKITNEGIYSMKKIVVH